MKRLIVVRHGKSDWNAPYDADHARPLSERGVRAARRIGVVLERAGERPDLVLSSSALRARSTAELASEAAGWDCPIEVTDELYGTSAAGTLDVVAAASDRVDRLMIVGHQPTWGMLIERLTGARVAVKTATAVGLDLAAADWRHAPGAPASIVYVLQPRMFDSPAWGL